MFQPSGRPARGVERRCNSVGNDRHTWHIASRRLLLLQMLSAPLPHSVDNNLDHSNSGWPDPRLNTRNLTEVEYCLDRTTQIKRARAGCILFGVTFRLLTMKNSRAVHVTAASFPSSMRGTVWWFRMDTVKSDSLEPARLKWLTELPCRNSDLNILSLPCLEFD